MSVQHPHRTHGHRRSAAARAPAGAGLQGHLAPVVALRRDRRRRVHDPRSRRRCRRRLHRGMSRRVGRADPRRRRRGHRARPRVRRPARAGRACWTAGTPAPRCGCSPACSRAASSSRCSSATNRCPAGRCAACSIRSRRWARASTVATAVRSRRSPLRGGGLDRYAPRVGDRERAGQDRARARGLAGHRHHRGRRARAEPRSHRAHARGPRCADHTRRRPRGADRSRRAHTLRDARSPAIRVRPHSSSWRPASCPAPTWCSSP